MTFYDLMLLAEQADSDPWEFFKTHNLKDLQKAAHPDKWPSEPSATSLFIRFKSAHDRSQVPIVYIGKHPLLRQIASGDLREIFLSTNGNLVKVPKVEDKAADKLIKKEKDILTLLKESSGANIIQYFYPHMVDSVTVNNKIHNVTIYDKKLYTAEQIKQYFPKGLDGRHIGWMLRRMLVGVGYAHSLGYCHGAITPEHMMFAPENHAGVLTGWIHAEKIGQKSQVVPGNRIDWYPDFAKKGLTPAVDFYMIGLLAEYLCDDQVPKKIRNFLKALKFPSIGVDALELDNDFKEILYDCYGKSKFVDLVINDK